MMNTKNALLALSAPQTAHRVPVMSHNDAVAFLDRLVTAPPAPEPPVPGVYILAPTIPANPAVEIFRTPAPIRALKDEGIIGVV